VASIITGMVLTVLEFDEIETVRKGDEIHYTIVTSGVMPSICELKTLIWSFLAPPVKKLEVVSIEELEHGPIVKRYKIHVKGKAKSSITSLRGQRKTRIRRKKEIDELMTEQPRFITSEPRFLNWLDEFLKEQPRTLVLKDGLLEIGLGFGKDLMRHVRARENIISVLGNIILVEGFGRAIKAVA